MRFTNLLSELLFFDVIEGGSLQVGWMAICGGEVLNMLEK